MRRRGGGEEEGGGEAEEGVGESGDLSKSLFYAWDFSRLLLPNFLLFLLFSESLSWSCSCSCCSYSSIFWSSVTSFLTIFTYSCALPECMSPSIIGGNTMENSTNAVVSFWS